MSRTKYTLQTWPGFLTEPHHQFSKPEKLEQAIKANLRGLGYGG